MKRKLSLLIGACMALVAFAMLPTSAGALVDQDCDGVPYDNSPLVHDFDIDTVNFWANFPSGSSGQGLVCGSSLGEGSDRLTDNAVVTFAEGVVIEPTVGDPSKANAYAGSASIRVLQKVGIFPATNPEFTDISMTVADPTAAGNDCPDTGTIACFRANSPLLGHNDNSVRIDENGRYELTIHKMKPSLGVAGITKIINFSLCQNLGAPGSGQCGSGSDPINGFNGDVSRPGCKNGRGIYSVEATLDDGTVTPAETTCVNWFPRSESPGGAIGTFTPTSSL